MRPLGAAVRASLRPRPSAKHPTSQEKRPSILVRALCSRLRGARQEPRLPGASSGNPLMVILVQPMGATCSFGIGIPIHVVATLSGTGSPTCTTRPSLAPSVSTGPRLQLPALLNRQIRPLPLLAWARTHRPGANYSDSFVGCIVRTMGMSGPIFLLEPMGLIGTSSGAMSVNHVDRLGTPRPPSTLQPTMAIPLFAGSIATALSLGLPCWDKSRIAPLPRMFWTSLSMTVATLRDSIRA